MPVANGSRRPSPAEETTVFATPVTEATVHGPVLVDEATETAETEDRRRSRRKLVMVAAGVFGLLVLLYGLDIAFSSGNVPRGVTVAGVDVGGLDHPAAEQKLRDQIGPRLAQPVRAQAGDVATEVDPKTAGLELDWAATLDRAGDQPLSPITRITSFFTSREVGIATRSDGAKLTAALEGLRAQTDHDPAEGTIRFEGANAVAVDPKQGQKLDVPAASEKILASWADGGTVDLPVATTPVKTTKEGVHKALEEVAKPAVAAPVVIKGEGRDATLTPEQLGATLVFEPAEDGGLTAKVDNNKVIEAAGPQLKETEKEGKDAEILFEGGRPTVKESVDGIGIDWEKSLTPFMDVLKSADKREIKAEYKHTPAKVTTEQANKMGIKEVIGEFSTGGFAADSGTNIRVVAEKVNGAIVKPGETFSLNEYTGPRGTAQGYVDAGIIENGAPGRAVGGGISQFATTLYNAAYHAGMKDAGHKEHSYWISRYPAGREATVFMDPAGNSLIDIKFTNPDDTGVAIQTIWTPSSIKIVLWGTKNYDVSGSTSEQSNFTDPKEITKTTQPCVASAGARGFTVTDTRTIRDRRTGQTRSESRTVRYDPSPKIVCEAPPAG
ncbi:VanW family protein [Saccharothrix sp. SC076]|nr:VanW family protein [Saccharothrix obliqua]MBW4715584.1 VanW family protein [Saccharothrix obliqua]